jgi:Protein of unknown function (DUF2844)
MRTGLMNILGSLTRRWLSIVMLWCLASVPEPAWAALGGDMESVDADQVAMNASEQITASTETFTVYELRISAGTVVKEYLSLAGNVFAVTWQGPQLPNLRQILGNYFTQYTEAAQDQHGGHGHLVIRQPDLVVESSGRMRAFFGRAYLPKALPQDVAVTDIQ